MISNRIKELRNYHGITQKELGALVNLSQQAVAKWEKGVAEPDTERIAILSDYFGVSSDYLLGRTDTKKEGSPAQGGEPSENAKLLDAMLLEAGIDIKTMTDSERQRAAAILKAAFEK